VTGSIYAVQMEGEWQVLIDYGTDCTQLYIGPRLSLSVDAMLR
jgi:hypothetical protein